MQKTDKETVGLHFFTRLKINNRDIGRTFFDILSQQIPDLLPNQVDFGKGWRWLDYSDLEPILNHFETKNTLLFRKINSFQTDMAFSLVNVNSGLKTIAYWIEESYFDEQHHIDLFLDASIELYNLIHPEYGLIHQTSEKLKMARIEEGGYTTILPINLSKGLPGIYWCNFFGPDFVDSIGEILLLSAPCCEVKKLLDGGILILTTPSPMAPQSEENRTIQDKIQLHLGKGNFWLPGRS
jgi:hypothetical protein